ncbi:MAG: hypothetical protein CVU88_06740 [Firmicutes bacterium HGW-Firmicutes-13]|nr:MAG: hypothetical protein CVU88_06740 [Firmicutes bacterium HGW-Firmicutes-13]
MFKPEIMRRKTIKFKKGRMFVFFTVFTMVLISVSLAYSFQNVGQGTVVEEEPYTLITVQKGDTLWSIAGTNRRKGEDIRSLIHEIRELNEFTEPTVYPGQQLLVPR